MKIFSFSFLFLFSFYLIAQPSHQDSLLLQAVKSNNFSSVQQFIEAGANPNTLDKTEAPLLMWAALNGTLKMVKYLVKNGADVRKKGIILNPEGGFYGNLVGIAAEKDKVIMLKYLIEDCQIPVDDKEWNKDTQQEDGWTALEWAAFSMSHNCVEYLLTKEADLDIAADKLVEYYREQGRYQEALPFAERALNYATNVLGENHPNYGERLRFVGFLYNEMGEYEKALPLYIKAVENGKRTLGENHIYYTVFLNSLGVLYHQMGEYEKALPLNQKALEITESILGNRSQLYVDKLNSLAHTYNALGNHQEALSLFLKAWEVSKDYEGKDLNYTHNHLGNIGATYQFLGDYEASLTFLKNSLDLIEKIHGKEHQRYGARLLQIGYVYEVMNDYESAEIYYQKALKNVEKSLGKNHKNYGTHLSRMIQFYQKTKQSNLAFPLLSSLNENLNFQIENRFIKINERLQFSFLAILREEFNQIASFLLDFPDKEELVIIGVDNQLQLKGLMQSNRSQLLNSLRTHPNAEVAQQYQKWESLHQLLSYQYAQPINRRLKSLDSLENEAEKLEVLLANHSTEFREVRQHVDWKSVQKTLKIGEAAIEFAHFQYRNSDSILYVAYLIQPEMEHPVFVPLFEEKQLTALLPSGKFRRAAYLNDFYSFHEEVRGSNIEAPNLYDLVWQPLTLHLKDLNTVYFSPTGLLHRLNLGAIAANPSETLSDRFQLVQMNSTRQLVNTSKATLKAQTAELYGGIDYELDATNLEEKVEKIVANDAEGIGRGSLSFAQTSTTLRGSGSWNALEWTDVEVQTLDLILQENNFEATVRTAQNATEEAFQQLGKNAPSPRILHLATHGYFFPDPEGNSQSTVGNQEGEPVFKISDHPMIRSGLILAGANEVWEGGNALEGREDGILTAYEISQMNLTNTELVVLSACETGLGDIEGNEGVYGLQRAFKIAGAKYLIMSLWQVPDFHTQELMTAFYTEWLDSKKTIPEAFRAAQKQMRERFSEPFYWAGFVLLE